MSDFSDNKASRGSIAQIIITALSSGDKYGYEICKEIERLSNGVLILKQPSLYSSLRRMEEQDLISSYWQDSDIGGKRHYYSLTEKGKEIYEQNKDTLNMDDLINNLPLNELDLEPSPLSTNKNENSTTIASQENLFNIVNKSNEIKLIKDDEIENKNKSFVQFDLFDQKINFIKDDSKNIDKVSLYSNKYEDLDKHNEEIEPRQNDLIYEPVKENKIDETIKENIIDKPIEEDIVSHDLKVEPITRDSIFGSKNVEFEAKIETNVIDNATENLDSSFIVDESKPIIEDEKKEEKIKYDSSKIVWEDISPNSKDDEALRQKSNDYKSVIGQLYNDSKLPDPYEENKFYTFKEIFPSAQVEEAHKEIENKQSEIDFFVTEKNKTNNLDNLKTLNYQFESHGLKIKLHKNENNKNNLRLYSDINKLNMMTSCFVSIIMMLEMILSYVILDNYNYVRSKQSLMFFLGGSMALSLLIVSLLHNLFDRFKLIIIKRQFKRDFIKAFLVFIFICVLTFAVCLICGMQSLGQVEFLSYWLVPILVASNIIIYCLIFHSLLKSRHYNN